MVTLRDLKLAVACGHESDEVKSINQFFDDLFSDVKIYKNVHSENLFFMKGTKCIIEQDLDAGFLWCKYLDFWKILSNRYKYTRPEIRDIILYKISEFFIELTQIPIYVEIYTFEYIESQFKNGELIPYIY